MEFTIGVWSRRLTLSIFYDWKLKMHIFGSPLPKINFPFHLRELVGWPANSICFGNLPLSSATLFTLTQGKHQSGPTIIDWNISDSGESSFFVSQCSFIKIHPLSQEYFKDDTHKVVLFLFLFLNVGCRKKWNCVVVSTPLLCKWVCSRVGRVMCILSSFNCINICGKCENSGELLISILTSQKCLNKNLLISFNVWRVLVLTPPSLPIHCAEHCWNLRMKSLKIIWRHQPTCGQDRRQYQLFISSNLLVLTQHWHFLSAAQ